MGSGEKVFRVLQQPEYVHVLINHLPLTGLFAALLCLIGALIFVILDINQSLAALKLELIVDE